MLKRNSKPSEAQMEILNAIWEKGEATIDDVLYKINRGRKKPLRRTTVQVQMARLEKKGWLAHRKDGKIYVYRALKEKNESLEHISQDIRNNIFNGSCAEMVKCFLKTSDVSEEELEDIRNFIEKMKNDGAAK